MGFFLGFLHTFLHAEMLHYLQSITIWGVVRRQLTFLIKREFWNILNPTTGLLSWTVSHIHLVIHSLTHPESLRGPDKILCLERQTGFQPIPCSPGTFVSYFVLFWMIHTGSEDTYERQPDETRPTISLNYIVFISLSPWWPILQIFSMNSCFQRCRVCRKYDLFDKQMIS